jgi:small subunit ribosomal protein S11
MGKKRIIQKGETGKRTEGEVKKTHQEGPVKSSRKILRGITHISATYNNTMILVTDDQGNAIAWSSAGSLGFSGAKKATPFAAARVAEMVAEKAKKNGVQDVFVRVSGVGSGRDSAIRALANHGLNIIGIKDVTPIPHNGPRSKKIRRV